LSKLNTTRSATVSASLERVSRQVARSWLRSPRSWSDFALQAHDCAACHEGATVEGGPYRLALSQHPQDLMYDHLNRGGLRENDPAGGHLRSEAIRP